MGCAKTSRFHFPCRKCDSLDDFGVIALRNTCFLGVYIIPFPPESASFDKVLWRKKCPMGRHWPCPSSLDLIRRRTPCAYGSFHVNIDFPWPHLIFRRYWRLEVSMIFFCHNNLIIWQHLGVHAPTRFSPSSASAHGCQWPHRIRHRTAYSRSNGPTGGIWTRLQLSVTDSSTGSWTWKHGQLQSKLSKKCQNIINYITRHELCPKKWGHNEAIWGHRSTWGFFPCFWDLRCAGWVSGPSG